MATSVLRTLPAPPSRRSGALARREGGRNEWGEGWGEGNPNKNGPPLPGPLLPLWGGEGEFLAASPVPFLNSMAVPLIPLPAPFTSSGATARGAGRERGH